MLAREEIDIYESNYYILHCCQQSWNNIVFRHITLFIPIYVQYSRVITLNQIDPRGFEKVLYQKSHCHSPLMRAGKNVYSNFMGNRVLL